MMFRNPWQSTTDADSSESSVDSVGSDVRYVKRASCLAWNSMKELLKAAEHIKTSPASKTRDITAIHKYCG